jgi:hypothetical protein
MAVTCEHERTQPCTTSATSNCIQIAQACACFCIWLYFSCCLHAPTTVHTSTYAHTLPSSRFSLSVCLAQDPLRHPSPLLLQLFLLRHQRARQQAVAPLPPQACDFCQCRHWQQELPCNPERQLPHLDAPLHASYSETSLFVFGDWFDVPGKLN